VMRDGSRRTVAAANPMGVEQYVQVRQLHGYNRTVW
jgi:hypothetical protein